MKVGKPMSKRVPVRLRHKIQKKSAAKQRKERKEAKKNPQWVSRLKKDPGIPNLFPYKAKVLEEIEEARRRKAEEQQQKRDLQKAQRLGLAEPTNASGEVEDEDEELMDHTEDGDDDDEMDDQDGSNPMAALLASAQARAQTYSKDDEDDDDEDDDDDVEVGKSSGNSKKPGNKVLPKKVLEDPVKVVYALLDRMQSTQDGIPRMLEHYQVPALSTSGTNLNSRFLVEVARKRGRLGKGGIPNMHAAALIVLNDVNEERLQLPTPQPKKSTSATGKGEVQIVSSLAQPFKLEGLWGDDGSLGENTMAMES